MFELNTTQDSLHRQPQPVQAEPLPGDGRRKKTRGRCVARAGASSLNGAPTTELLRHDGTRKTETGRARKSGRAPKAPATAPAGLPPENPAPEKPGKPAEKAAPEHTSKRTGKSSRKSAPDDSGKPAEKAASKHTGKRAGKSPRKAAPDASGEAVDTAAPDDSGKPADTAAPDNKPDKKSVPWSHEDPLGFALHLIREKLGGAPEKLYETGKSLIRFRTTGSSLSGWARVTRVKYGRGKESYVITYGDWRTGEHYEWHSQEPSTSGEKEAFDQELRQIKEAQQREEQARHLVAKGKAERLWRRSRAATTDNPYLQRKNVQPHSARTGWGGLSDVLFVPLCDAEWKIWNLQFIQPDGGKRFLKGGRVSGLFHPFGTREDFERGKAILVCEGWATGATLHEATGLPVAAAMNCGNLLPAARALRDEFPGQKLVICADDDWKTAGNPGVTKAEKAACSVGAAIVVPLWSVERGEKDTDFNDLALVEGLDAVRRQVDSILSQPVRPGLDERPCYWVLEEPAVIGEQEYKAGVYYCGIEYEKQFGKVVPVPTETWLSSPIRLEARTTEWPDGAQGVRLSVWNGRGWRHAMLPRETLASRRYREILYACGAQLTPENRPELAGYLQQDTVSREYVTSRTGWHGQQYVLPDVTVGTGATILFTGKRATDEPLTSGELADWQKSVAALAAGNPLLAFSIALAFTGPLLQWVRHNAVLVQLVGRSTTGKTTCLEAANSVVGPPALVTTWRATANGLEQRALVHCDGFLALDEIGQVDAKVLDHAVYTLANGAAKQRATVYEHGVGAAPMQRWRVAALSTGEKTIETLLAMDKRNVNAGQAVRFIEIPAEERYGAFTTLHGYESGAAFADALRWATHHYYGTPIRAFLEKLCNDDRKALNQALDECTARLRAAVASSDAAPGAQASRVLTSIALVALAGELATRYGITGWQPGTAFDAARYCFRLWAQSRPTQTDFEQVDILRRLRDFIDKHGDSRFSECSGDAVVYDRAGYYRDTDDGREYLFTREGFKDAVRGFDLKLARKTLADLNVLKTSGGRDTVTVRLSEGYKRLFCISYKALDEALEKLGGDE
jgi:putative DNA primase/helicase